MSDTIDDILRRSQPQTQAPASGDASPDIARIFTEEGANPNYGLAMAGQEGGRWDTPTSGAGAEGPLQVKPSTGLRFVSPEEWATPEGKIRASARYTRFLSEKFNDNPELVFAGYHAGEGAVEAAGNRVPNTYDPYAKISTAQHVKRVMANYQRLTNSGQSSAISNQSNQQSMGGETIDDIINRMQGQGQGQGTSTALPPPTQQPLQPTPVSSSVIQNAHGTPLPSPSVVQPPPQPPSWGQSLSGALVEGISSLQDQASRAANLVGTFGQKVSGLASPTAPPSVPLVQPAHGTPLPPPQQQQQTLSGMLAQVGQAGMNDAAQARLRAQQAQAGQTPAQRVAGYVPKAVQMAPVIGAQMLGVPAWAAMGGQAALENYEKDPRTLFTEVGSAMAMGKLFDIAPDVLPFKEGIIKAVADRLARAGYVATGSVPIDLARKIIEQGNFNLTGDDVAQAFERGGVNGVAAMLVPGRPTGKPGTAQPIDEAPGERPFLNPVKDQAIDRPLGEGAPVPAVNKTMLPPPVIESTRPLGEGALTPPGSKTLGEIGAEQGNLRSLEDQPAGGTLPPPKANSEGGIIGSGNGGLKTAQRTLGETEPGRTGTEPWRMTRDEYVESRGGDISNPADPATRAALKEHAAAVEQARAAGENVPPNVLEDYPEIERSQPSGSVSGTRPTGIAGSLPAHEEKKQATPQTTPGTLQTSPTDNGHPPTVEDILTGTNGQPSDTKPGESGINQPESESNQPAGASTANPAHNMRGNIPSNSPSPTQPTVPEASATIKAQMEALKAETRGAVLITPGEQMPEVPEGLKRTETPLGTFIHLPQISRAAVIAMAQQGTHHQILGIVEPKSEKTTRTVVARDPQTGTELQAALVSPEREKEQVRLFKRMYPGAKIETGGLEKAQEVVSERVSEGANKISTEGTTQPAWLQQNIDQLNDEAERRGLADQIEELSARRFTARQIAGQLKVDEDLVRAVRAKRNIPSMDDRSEFEQWRNSWIEKDRQRVGTSSTPEKSTGVTSSPSTPRFYLKQSRSGMWQVIDRKAEKAHQRVTFESKHKDTAESALREFNQQGERHQAEERRRYEDRNKELQAEAQPLGMDKIAEGLGKLFAEPTKPKITVTRGRFIPGQQSTEPAEKPSAPRSQTEIEQAFDEAFDKLFGEGPSFQIDEPGQVASEDFDDDVYEVAKPYFTDALAHFQGQDVRAAMTKLLQTLVSNYNFSPGQIKRMKPYIVRFIGDWQNRSIITSKENAGEETSTTSPSQTAQGRAGAAQSTAPPTASTSTETADRPARANAPSEAAEDRAAAVETEEGQAEPIRAGDQLQPASRGGSRSTSGPRSRPLPSERGDGDAGRVGAGGGRDESGAGLRHGDLGTESEEPTETAAQPETGAPKVGTDETTPKHIAAGDYHEYDPARLSAGGSKTKFKQNIAAIKLVRQLEAEGRTFATPEEQETLALYSGWGQFPQLFTYGYTSNGEDASKWSKEKDELRELLDDDEFEAARRSTLNAHYTAPEIVAAMWEMAEKMGFTGGRVLEPSMGSGNFFALMPPALKGRSKITGVELDKLTGKIAKLLYPKSNIQVKGFQDLKVPNNFYDLVISNVPFGNYHVNDKTYNRFAASIHNYFFLKAIDLVRPGGLVMFITSTGTMDNRDRRIREELVKKGELVAAMRFPESTFQKSAGTAVVTDLIILRKRATEAEASETAPEDFNQWTRLGVLPDPDGGEEIPINEYFVAHPDQILGRLDRKSRLYGDDDSHVSKTDDFEERFDQAQKKIPKDVYTEAAKPESYSPKRLAANITETKEGAYEVNEGALYRREGDHLVEQEADAKTIQRVRGMVEIRKALHQVFKSQLDGEAPESTDDDRKTLNTAYDKFVRRFGFLHDSPNVRAFQDDPDSPTLLALENWNKKTKKATKTEVFTKNTIRIYNRPSKVKRVSEALGISLNDTGRVDIPRISNLLDQEPETVQKALVEEGLAYNDPKSGWTVADLYLSGNVRRKLVEARDAASADEQYAPNVTALEKVQPADLDPTEIDVRLGAPWIPPSDIKQFMMHLVGGRENSFEVGFVVSTGRWVVGYTPQGSAYVRGSKKTTEVWGTPRAEFMDVIEAALLDKPIMLYDLVKEGESVKKVLNPTDSAAANVKVKEVRDAFKDWIWEDDERRERLSRYYNDNFNNIRIVAYDAAHYKDADGKFVLPGMNPAIELRTHQANAVWQIVTNGTALLAHEVGTGKTFTMVAAAMELRRLGLAKKPSIAVPKAIIEGFVAEARKLYPSAKIITTEGRFDAKQRQKTIAQVATGDWDLVIMTHDNMNMLPMRPEVVEEFIRAELDELEAVIRQAREAEGTAARRGAKKKSESRLVKQLEKSKANLEAKLKEAIEGTRTDAAVYFEETGIDQIFVDEAHKYKSLPVYTSRNRIKGVPQARSDRAMNMLMRARWLQRENDGRGIVFATGTPVANTMVELFNMQRYLQYAELEARGIHSFDGWANTFGETTTKMEYAVTGDFQGVTRFAKYTNLPELLALTRSVMDVKRVDDLGGQVVRPQREEEVISVPMSETQRHYLDHIKVRAAAIKTGRVDPRDDNMLKLSSDARKLSLDMRLIEPSLEALETKARAVAEKVLEIHAEKPDVTQMIFSDIGVSKTDWGFSLYGDIADKLEEGGILRSQIIDFSTLTDKQKETAVERLKTGEALVAIGSTDKLGTGVNAQDHLYAVHHVDVPWLPASVEQRDGRIWRQGNLNPKIKIFRYVTTGSFDTFMWQLVDSKSRFIKQAMKGDIAQRVFKDDDSEELSPAKIMAIASGNPDFLIKVNLDEEIADLERQKRSHDQQQFRLRKDIRPYEDRIEETQAKLDAFEKDLALVEASKDQDFSLEIGGQTYEDKAAAGDAIAQALKLHWTKNKPVKIGSFRGFDLYLRPAARDGYLQRPDDENEANEYRFSIYPAIPAQSNKFFVSQFGNFSEVAGEPVEVPGYESIPFFQYEEDGKIYVATTEDGRPYGYGNTLGVALKDAVKRINNEGGPEVLKGRIKAALESENVSPRIGREAKPEKTINSLTYEMRVPQQKVEYYRHQLEAYTEDAATIRSQIGKPFKYTEDLKEKKARLDEVMKRLSPQEKKESEPAQSDEPVSEPDEATGTDDEGPDFHRAQQETESFRRWFGKSEVVDDDGRPLRVYHGTSHEGEIEAFDPDAVSQESLFGPGFYFTEDPQVAGGTLEPAYNWTSLDKKPDLGYAGKGAGLRDVTISKLKDLREYFTPGRIVPSYGGYDKVLAFHENDRYPGDWSVDVIEVTKDGQPVRGAYPRNHRTMPTVRREYGSPHVYAAYLKIQNPLRLDDPITFEVARKLVIAITGSDDLALDLKDRYLDEEEETGKTPTVEETLRIFNRQLVDEDMDRISKEDYGEIAERAGFDGITHMGGRRVGDHDHRVWIAFKPTQVKSAVGNQGSFSPEEAKIDQQARWDTPPYTQAVGFMESLVNARSRYRTAKEGDDEGVLFTNGYANVTLRYAIKEVENEDPGKLLGGHVGKFRAQLYVNKLREMAGWSFLTEEESYRLSELANNLQQAVRDNPKVKTLIIVDNDDARSLIDDYGVSDIENTLAHEETHRFQAQGGKVTDQWIEQDPDYPQLHHHLATILGYPERPGMVAKESLAHILGGEWEKLGYTGRSGRQRAAAFVSRYLDQLVRERGVFALSKLRYYHPAFNSIIEGAKDAQRANQGATRPAVQADREGLPRGAGEGKETDQGYEQARPQSQGRLPQRGTAGSAANGRELSERGVSGEEPDFERPSFQLERTKRALGAEDAQAAIGKIAQLWVESEDLLRRGLDPASRKLPHEKEKNFAGPTTAEVAGMSVRRRASDAAQENDQAYEKFAELMKSFDLLPKEVKEAWIDAVETGEIESIPETPLPQTWLTRLKGGFKPNSAASAAQAKRGARSLREVARMVREHLDARRDEVQYLGTGALEHWIENYFPHIWQRPDDAKAKFAKLAKRPLEGRKAFLKKRTIPTTAEGREMGLVPVSDNPLELLLLKDAEMVRYIFAQKVLKDLKDQGMRIFVRGNQKGPDGWAMVDDRVSTVYGRSEENELVIRGHYYVPEPAAVLINNYLMPGLAGRQGWGPLYRTVRGVANWMVQFQLAFSAFHLSFVLGDAYISRLALGLHQVMTGRGGEGIKTAATAPAGPVLALTRGHQMMKAWYTPDEAPEEFKQMVSAMKLAGGRALMPAEYRTKLIKGMMAAYRKGAYVGAGVRLPFAAIEAMMVPIMEWVVPRMKMGVFYDIARSEMDRLGLGATDAQMVAALQKVWDSVDNRLGQLVYDDLFWNPIIKDLSMIAVRSVGWNLGSVREIGGGITDTARFGRDFIKHGRGGRGGGGGSSGLPPTGGGFDHGKGPEFTHRMSYIVALPLGVALLGLLWSLFRFGRKPDDWRDYFFWKTGLKDDQGRDVRISPPFYTKDVYHFWEDPMGTFANKLNPLISGVAEDLRNKDFYGNQIHNADDPWIKRRLDDIAHLGTNASPMSIKNYQREKEQGSSTGMQVGQFIGLPRAPVSLTETKAERKMYEILSAKGGEQGRTPEQAERKEILLGLKREVRSGQDVRSDIRDAYAAGAVSAKQLRDAWRAGRETPAQSAFKKLDLREAMQVWDLSTPEEQQSFKPLLAAKAQHTLRGLPLRDREELLPRVRKALGQ